MKLTDKAKRSIHAWSAAGLGHRAIATRLERELGISVSHVAVGKVLAREAPPIKASSRRSSPSPSPSSRSPSSPGAVEESAAGTQPPVSPRPAGSPTEQADDTAEELRILRRLRRTFFRAAIRPRATALDRRRATETLLEILNALRLSRPTTPSASEESDQLEADALAALERMRAMQ